MVVLPEPDSPTTPSVWPLRSWKSTPLTALNSVLLNRPDLKKKLLRRPLACRITGASGSLALPAPWAERPAMWSSMTISRAGFSSSEGRQASSALV